MQESNEYWQRGDNTRTDYPIKIKFLYILIYFVKIKLCFCLSFILSLFFIY